MASLQQIQSRRKAVKNVGQITKAMEVVADRLTTNYQFDKVILAKTTHPGPQGTRWGFVF